MSKILALVWLALATQDSYRHQAGREATMDRLVPQNMDQFRQVMEHNARTHEWKGLILTGSEITLHHDLPKWARLARQHGFEHVRIQTHGMRLASRSFCEELIDAGVDEFFISMAAGDAATHDAITQVPGSFDKTLRGIELLDEFDSVTTITKYRGDASGILVLLSDERKGRQESDRLPCRGFALPSPSHCASAVTGPRGRGKEFSRVPAGRLP